MCMDTAIKLYKRGVDSHPGHFKSILGRLKLYFAEEQAIWLPGDVHLQKLIPKFLRNKDHYPELNIFTKMEYSFDKKLRLEDASQCLVEMFEIHDHIPQAIVIILGVNSIGATTKAQMRARAEDMITDCTALWDQACLQPKLCIGLFVSLVPPCLWYAGFLDQKAGREAQRSLNSHIGKICKMLKVTVIPHPRIAVEEKWFHDPRSDPLTLSEPGYDLFLRDICLAVAAKLQFSSIPEQREVAAMYWHQAPPPVPEQPALVTKKRHRRGKGRSKHRPF